MSYRRPVKPSARERQHNWRDKFKEQCAERVKQARQQATTRRREETWMQHIILQEWETFKRTNEEALQREGVGLDTNLDAFEANLYQELQDEYDPTYDEMMQEEEAQLARAFEDYQQTSGLQYPNSCVCLKCRQSLLQPTVSNGQNCFYCNQCGFHVLQETLTSIQRTMKEHDLQCNGAFNCMVEPGTNDSIIGVCDICDLWAVF
ncbi:uncharacterized protein BYT42DRAFT_610780 [Radiomyces spectabilis]|uniref:uncharacterized protein n=1 Tax=Radiomyces spectabilis TaxID=64574 RepID=UPI00221E6AD4|nr:uncharacterized protein BYT42DRAFT_610780 [Radiomyces spectabilis]KAI8391568.1 hypothetical protein BYT42DRAFT_610780 [Radiomyces spectabilis]